jgi:alpha-L-rhamnosidase
MKKIFLILSLMVLTMTVQAGIQVGNLRVNGLPNPLGIDSASPIFSWHTQSTERGFLQSAYQISVSTADGAEVWNSGKVNSDSQTQIKYKGSPLTSRTSYTWSVRVWDAMDNESDISTGTFETAFMEPSEWTAKWIHANTSSEYRARVEVPLNLTTRYIKIDATKLGLDASSDAKGYYLQLAEVQVISSGTNIAKSATFTASEEMAWGNNWGLKYINDGVIYNGTNLGYTSNKQSATNYHVWIQIDLGAEKNVQDIVLYPRQDDHATSSFSLCANFPSSYTIQTSSNGSTYDTQFTATDAEAPAYDGASSTQIPYMGRGFSVSKEVKRARIYATALGVFNMKMNGHAVTENVLEPGETEYAKSLLYSTYDVTSLIQQGRNTLMAQVAGGIFNVTSLDGRYTKPEIKNTGESSLKAELFIDYTDGTTDHIVTDANWQTNSSPTTGSNWWGGEDYDARKVVSHIDDADIDLSNWTKAVEMTPTSTVLGTKAAVGTLKARMYEPLRVVEEWKATKVTALANGDYLVDFGRNFAGTYSFTLSGENGQNIHLREAEKLSSDGTAYQDYYYSRNSVTYDSYTFAGTNSGETWGPQFMYHGFRYLQISGLKSAPSAMAFTAKRIRSNIGETGHFETSNTLLNNIHTICHDAIASQLYNSITDCPQREKLGWLDVPNEMYNSLALNFDMQTFFSKTVMDCFDAQGSNGYVPSTVPHYMKVYDDDPNWGGAAILIPYRNLNMYGDRSLMEKYYPRMKQLIDYYTSLTNNYIMPGKSYSVLSDWGQNTCGLANETPTEFTITTTYYYLLQAMADMATEMGETTDASTYKNLASKVKTAFNTKFFGNRSAGVYDYGNQAEYGMALYYGLVDSTNIATAAQKLAEKVEADNYRIKTGEIGLKPVLMSLAANGYNDIVYKMACQTDYPSYGYFVKQGCTTTPEYWDMSLSQNHCMMDHIEEWFFSELGGIKNNGTAYNQFIIQPWIPSDMNALNVSTETIYGIITSAWKRYADGYKYHITIPENTLATVNISLSGNNAVLEDGMELTAGYKGIISVNYKNNFATIVLGSGTYIFTVGNVTRTDEAKDETFWLSVHSTSDLTEGSEIKIQETGHCNHYDSSWKSGRFIGYSQGRLPSEGAFVTAAPLSLAPTFTIENPTSYTVDGKESFGCRLKYGNLYLNSNGDSGKMLSWNAASRPFGFDIADGDVTFYRLNDAGKREGNYIFFYDNGWSSGINAYGTSTDYAPQWMVYKKHAIQDAGTVIPSATANHDSIFYTRIFSKDGNVESIVLPFDLNSDELPLHFEFYMPTSVESGNIYLQQVTELVAGKPYFVKYTGKNTSEIPEQVDFHKCISETTLTPISGLTGTYAYLTSTDVSANKYLYILNADGTAMKRAADTDVVSPFRVALITDNKVGTPEEFKLVFGISTSISKGLLSVKDQNEKTYSLNGFITNNNPHQGIYIINGKKTVIK